MKTADAIFSSPRVAAMLVRLRKICAGFPASDEIITFGHPTFQAAGKTFAALEVHKGELGLAIKVERELQSVFLKDSRFFPTPYAAKHGWVTLRVHEGAIDWREVRELLRGSYHLATAPRKRSVSK